MTPLEHLEKLRAPLAKELRLVRSTLFVATAACAAIAASDMLDNNLVSALGNFGLLCILERMYLLAPMAMAKVRGGTERWIRAEKEFLRENFPWCDVLGKLGWGCLMISVVTQLMQGVGGLS